MGQKDRSRDDDDLIDEAILDAEMAAALDSEDADAETGLAPPPGGTPAAPSAPVDLARRGEALAVGARRGVTFGGGDEMTAGMRTAGNKAAVAEGDPYGDAAGRVDRAGDPAGFQDFVREERDYEGELERDEPGSMLAGDVLGTAATMPFLPGGAAVKGASALARGTKAANLGAKIGGVEGLGRGNQVGESTGGAIATTAAGAIAGATGGVVGEALTAGLSKAASRLAESDVGQSVMQWAATKSDEFGDEAARARTVAGGARYAKDAKNIEAMPGGTEAFGRDMHELGIGSGKPKIGTTDLGGKGRRLPGEVEDFLADAKPVREAAGGQMEWVSTHATNNGIRVDGDAIAARLDKIADEFRGGTDATKDAALATIEEAALRFETRGDLGDAWTFREVHKQRQSWQKGTNFASETLPHETRQSIARAINMELREALQTADPSLLKSWNEATRAWQVSHNVIEAAETKIAAESRNRSTSLTDYLSSGAVGGGTFAHTGDASTALMAAGGAAVLNKVKRGREKAGEAGFKQYLSERLAPGPSRGANLAMDAITPAGARAGAQSGGAFDPAAMFAQTPDPDVAPTTMTAALDDEVHGPLLRGMAPEERAVAHLDLMQTDSAYRQRARDRAAQEATP